MTFSLPSEACRNSTYDNQCIITNQVDSRLANKKIAMWMNRMRFDQLEYSKDSPLVKESQMKWFDFPNL